MRYCIMGFLVLFVLLACSCSGDLGTTPEATGVLNDSVSLKHGTTQSRPFKATLEGESVAPDDPGRCGSLITVGLGGSGNGTHMGRFIAVHSHCIDPAIPGPFTDGEFVWKAANGDEVHGTYSGVLQPTDQPNIFSIENPFEITGGTGRFSNATGSGWASGAVNLAEPNRPFYIDFDGSIVY